jgi:esterase/lipase
MEEFKIGPLKILKSQTDHRKALLYFHGFPGPYEALPPGEFRIVDALRDDIVKAYDFYYPLYSLKEERAFNFEETIADGMTALEFVLQNKAYDSIVLVGQSWGAIIAMAVSRQFQFEKILLITPFLALPTGEAAVQLFNHYSARYPRLLPQTEKARFQQQIENISNLHNPQDALQATRTEIFIFASENDEVISLKKIREAVGEKSDVYIFVLPGQTHKVEDRGALQTLVRGIL